MKPTGSYNPFTGEPIMQVEEHDITFWGKDWEELTLNEKADFCSLNNIGYLSDANHEYVSTLYLSQSLRNR